MAAVGSATAVEAGSTLVVYATPNIALNPHYYAMVLSVDALTYGTIAPTGEITTPYFDGTKFTFTLTGVAAGTTVITAEIKQVSYATGSRVLTSFDTPMTDTLSITVGADQAPSATAVHTVADKKVVYTFSEKVQLITGNDLWPGYPGPIIPFASITHDLFAIYELNESYEYVLTDGVAVAVADVAVSALTFDATGKIATFIYTGTIPNVSGHHYVIDCMGYTITDEVGTELAISVGATFDYQ